MKVPAMCDERERLIGFVYDECDASERELIEAHLDACSTCRTEISALRDVRQDLLAWRVPAHEPIWRPLPVAAAPVLPWWRQVPAWALATAASLMFVSGLAGGALASAWLPRTAPEAGRQTAAAAVVTPAELTQAEQRIIQLMRRELSGIDHKVSMAAAPAAPARVVNASFPTSLAAEMRGLQTESEERDRKLLEVITQTNMDLARMRSRLRDDVLAELRTGGSPGGGSLNK
jgi:putative zinc finger protein